MLGIRVKLIIYVMCLFVSSNPVHYIIYLLLVIDNFCYTFKKLCVIFSWPVGNVSNLVCLMQFATIMQSCLQ